MDLLKRIAPDRSSFAFRHAKELGFGLLAVAAVIVAVLALTARPGGVGTSPVPVPSVLEKSRARVPNVDIIGDAYVAGADKGGLGAANWTKIVGSRFYEQGLPVAINVIGHPGAGYTVRGPGKFTFAEAANTSLRSTADLVLVFGGRNDGPQEAPNMTAAAKDLYARIRERAPQAKLLVVGPAWTDAKVPDFVASNSQAIGDAASAAGADFISPLKEGWFFGADSALIDADGVHPTDAGHQYLAEKMYNLISKDLAAVSP
ncbi:SGNH/GDSL hydrolase family protein [Arthrobacter sp. NPDC058192]|uniref:SGNH/GDSL hydrolase family protein n=1 Tax=Arthrobacter sp. NPDC058192 TaxID=3346372 RepID=UPI0036E29ECB